MSPPPFHASLPGGGMAGMGGMSMGGGGGLGMTGMGMGGGGGGIGGMAYSQPGTASISGGGGYGGVGFGLPGGGNPSAAGVVGGLGMVDVPEGMFGMSLHGEQPYMSNLSISALSRAASGAGYGSGGSMSGSGSGGSGSSYGSYGSQRIQPYGHGQALAQATAQYLSKGYGKAYAFVTASALPAVCCGDRRCFVLGRSGV
jgi:hypothetical protein